MDAAYFHLLVNHFPIILAIVGAVAAVLALVLRRRGLWLYATATLAAGGLTAIPTFLSGNGAEEIMEDSWFVSRQALHAHEESGELALWVLLAMGVVALYAWWRLYRTRAEDPQLLPTWLKALVVVTALAGAGAASWTSYQGGFVVHKAEALQSAPPGYVRPAAPPEAEEREGR